MPRPATAVLLLLLAAACNAPSSDATAERTVTTDSAGVRRREIPATERPLDSALVEVARIAPADSGPASFDALRPGNVATNAVDRLYVLVTDESRIAVFDDGGALQASWGRRGGGPGEIGFGDDLTVDADGTVWLFDYQQGAFVRFDSAGAPLPIVRVPNDSAGSAEAPLFVTPDGVAFVRRRQEDDSVHRALLLATATDTATLRPQAQFVTRDVSFPSCPMLRMSGLPPYFSPDLTVVRTPRGVAIQPDGTWRVEWYEGARLTEVWTRALPPRASDATLLAAEIDGALTLRFGDNSCTVPPEEAGAARGVVATLPALRRIAVAPDGSLWAERWEARSASPRVDVLSPDGTLRGTITGRGAPLGFLRGGRVVYAETDPATELASLVIYRVRDAAW